MRFRKKGFRRSGAGGYKYGVRGRGKSKRVRRYGNSRGGIRM